MSAVSGITYVYVRDGSTTTPEPNGDTAIQFANYNEAMSWAKWISGYVGTGVLFIWNYNGGSGYWINNSFTAVANNNWP